MSLKSINNLILPNIPNENLTVFGSRCNQIIIAAYIDAPYSSKVMFLS